MSSGPRDEQLVTIADDSTRWSVGISRYTIEHIRDSREPALADALSVWMFYAYIARWQKGDAARATTPYVMQRLGLSRPRVRAARKLLLGWGLITDVQEKRGRSLIDQHHVRVSNLALVRHYDGNCVLLPDDPNCWSVGMTRETMERLLKQKYAADLIAVWMFYAYTARWQRVSAARAVVGFVCKGMRLSEERVKRARRILSGLDLIEDKTDCDSEKRVKGWYVQVHFLVRIATVDDRPSSLSVGGKSTPKCSRTPSLNAQELIPTRKSLPPDPADGQNSFFHASPGKSHAPLGKHSTPRTASTTPELHAVAHQLRSNYQSRMGYPISRGGSQPEKWLRIARNFQATTADPLEFMDAMFQATLTDPHATSPAGDGPWPKQMMSADWCRRQWEARLGTLTNSLEGPNDTPGQAEWRLLLKMATQSLKGKFSDKCELSPKLLAYFCDPIQSIPPIIRCALSSNAPPVLAGYEDEAVEYLRLRHAVARCMQIDGYPLPPGFVSPPFFLHSP